MMKTNKGGRWKMEKVVGGCMDESNLFARQGPRLLKGHTYELGAGIG